MIKLISLIFCGIVLLGSSTTGAEHKTNDEYIIQTKIIKSPVGSVSFVSSKLSFSLNVSASQEMATTGGLSKTKTLKLISKIKELIVAGASSEEMEKTINKIMGKTGSISVRITPDKANKSSKTEKSIKKAIKNKQIGMEITEISEILKKNNSPISIKMDESKYVMHWNNPKTAESSSFSINPIDGSFTVPIGSGKVKLNGVDLTVKKNELFWNNSKTPPVESGIDVIQCPDLIVTDSKESTAMIISQMEYFIEDGKGTYKLQTIPPAKSPGIIIKVAVSPKKANIVRLNMKVKLNVLKNRETLRGTTLKVGKPVIATNEFTQTLTTKVGDWIMTCGYYITEKSKKQSNQIYLIQRVLAKP